MRTVYLHIGTEKTGTTTVQDLLAANREQLNRLGYVYPSSPGESNHVFLAMYASNLPNEDLFRVHLRTVREDARESFERQFPEDLRRELQAFPDQNIILSNEHCSSRMHSREELATLKKLLCEFASRVVVIVYLRRQDQVLVSHYSTLIKAGSSKEPNVPPPQSVIWHNYASLIDLWASEFGKENIKVRVFERGQFKNGRLEDDFLECVGIGSAEGFNLVPAMNASLDRIRLDFLRRFNKFLPNFGRESVSPLRGNIVELLMQRSTKSLLSLDPGKLAEFYAYFAESNRRVAVEYLGRGDGVLFKENPDQKGREPYREITVDEAVQIATELWAEKQQQIARLKEQNAQLQGELKRLREGTAAANN